MIRTNKVTSPGVLPPIHAVAPLGRISPSRYLSLKECRLREVWAANHVAVMLPISARARLGSAIHSLLEEAGKHPFTSRDQIEKSWKAIMTALEAQMQQSW